MTDSASFSGTMPVREKLRFDTGALEAYLREHLAGFEALGSVAQFKGGQSNPTYLVTERSGAAYVLRRKPPGKLLPSAHAVDREYRVMHALGDTPVPVPEAHLLCEDPEVIGTAFFLMSYAQGRIFWDPTLPGMDAAERDATYRAMVETLADLHAVDYRGVGLETFGRPSGYIARQIRRWSKQYRASETEPIPSMDRLIDWLPEHVPPGEETSIVHGDYRLDNMVFHPTEPRVIAILDWELSTIGHPLADLANHCMAWRIPNRPPLRGLAGVDVAALGIPTEAEHAARYFARTGRDPVGPQAWEFFMAYNLFRLAAIAQGIAKRAQIGTASSSRAVEMGAMARGLADAAWSHVAD